MKVVLKIGGSLSGSPQRLRSLCKLISKVAKHHEIVIIPGGGVFTDLVRRMDKLYMLGGSASHWMAIYGMNQYGYLLAELLDGSIPCQHLDDVQSAWSKGRLPVFLPASYLQQRDALSNSWLVTSDSIAAYLAGMLGVTDLMVVTDVDGVFQAPPTKGTPGVLVFRLSTEQLKWVPGGGGRDVFFPYYLERFGVCCAIVNGAYPSRLQALLEGRPTITTRIFLAEG